MCTSFVCRFSSIVYEIFKCAYVYSIGNFHVRKMEKSAVYSERNVVNFGVEHVKMMVVTELKFHAQRTSKKVAQLRTKETKETKKTVWENVIVFSMVEIITEVFSN